MFLGTYAPNVMEKGRVALPKKIREELGGGRMVLTVGFDSCIFGFTEKEWENVTRPELARPLFSDKEGRDLRRKMCSEAVNIELDSQGRFIIPIRMMEVASIRGEVVLIGAGDHFEIWSKNVWSEYKKFLEKGA
ncbi:division/cell wall cluster transcriptional repressor MraZ [Candidatus Gottesmanbacteria bacterium]|nr:division/cell wall cluster transcriptional repressor MraZ [Candidatus Gottesmanbacteria bacterium]